MSHDGPSDDSIDDSLSREEMAELAVADIVTNSITVRAAAIKYGVTVDAIKWYVGDTVYINVLPVYSIHTALCAIINYCFALLSCKGCEGSRNAQQTTLM